MEEKKRRRKGRAGRRDEVKNTNKAEVVELINVWIILTVEFDHA